jgi:hypothetical protein
MATLKYKMGIFKRFKYFVLYERYIFNISSGLTLWLIYSNLQPAGIYLFTLPNWICIAGSILAVFLIGKGTV